MRSSGLNRRRFEAFTPTATTTSSNSVDARTMMSMCPLVTGSNDPGHAARRTAYSFGPGSVCIGGIGGHRGIACGSAGVRGRCATVPKQGLAVLAHPVADEPVRPLERGAPTRALHDHES